MKISGYLKHIKKCDVGIESFSIKGVPKMFPTVTGNIVVVST
jgi:hypothetical protein